MRYYDISAQFFLIGRPLPAHFWIKPLYTFFLSILHLLAGENYALIIGIQVVFLATIPALVFLLVSIISNRSAGLIAALLVMMRELNGISLSNIIQISNSKLLISDSFTMLWMVLLVLLMVAWLRNPSERRVMPLAIGGTFSLLIFCRGNSILIFPVLLIVIVIRFIYRKSNLWREGIMLITLGMMIFLVPWVWRNYQLTGKLTLQDTPLRLAGQLTRLYSLEPNGEDEVKLPNETKEEFQARTQKQILAFVAERPGDVVRFVSAHYFHNLIFSYIHLPQSFQIESVRSYARRLPFWSGWTGQFSVESYVLLIVNSGIIALGAGVLWKKVKVLIFIPLFIGLGYNLSISVFRLSGWRFIVPFDWIIIILYSVGLLQIAKILLAIFSGENSGVNRETNMLSTQIESVSPLRWTKLTLLSLLFSLIIFGITTGHNFVPYLFPSVKEAILINKYKAIIGQTDLVYSATELEEFLRQDNATIVYGRALYPSYLSRKKGEWNIIWPVFDLKPYNRIAFHLIGSYDIGVVLRQDSPPKLFPDAADVIVIGCITKSDYVNFIDGLVVLVDTKPAQVLVHSLLPDLTCPLP